MSTKRFPSPDLTRLALVVALPLAVLFGGGAVSHALTLKTWSAGDTLTAAELNANFQAIENELAPQPWAPATLATGWTNWPGTTYDGASYRKMRNVVYLRGVLSGADFAATNTITTLPAGYRPQRRKIFTVPCLNQTSCRVDILADGTVMVFGGTGTGFLGVDSVSFPLD